MANGDHHSASHTTVVHVELGGQQEECTLLAMPMPDYDVFLGKAWLDRHATQIDWTGNAVTQKPAGG